MKLTKVYLEALKGAIIEKHMKAGIKDVVELQKRIEEELPQLICDAVNSVAENMKDKDRMQVACCGCRNSINLALNAGLVRATPGEITYKSTCPICGFEHRIVVTRW